MKKGKTVKGFYIHDNEGDDLWVEQNTEVICFAYVKNEEGYVTYFPNYGTSTVIEMTFIKFEDDLPVL
jgi:hypothetical protein